MFLIACAGCVEHNALHEDTPWEEDAAIAAVMEQKKRDLRASFTDEERAFVDSLVASGGAVSVGIVGDAYPASFYNKVEKKYQGIAPEILDEVTLLTGIRFEGAASPASTIAELLRNLREGELSLVTQVLYSESRKDDYLWSEVPYLSSRYALLSKLDFPKIDSYRVSYYRVGVIERSIHAEMFDRWYPGHRHRKSYPTGDAAFNALERGEIDMVMVAASMLWALTNFREKTGYKVNVSFDDYQESRLGYNKSEERLRNVVDKAIEFIDIAGIRDDWMTRTFDYSRKMAQQRMGYAIAIAVMAVAAVLILILLLGNNSRLSKGLILESEKHKAAEARAVEASNIKSRFLANMSHEIRTPLNAIIGISELLATEHLTRRQRGYVKDIGQASHSLLSIVSDILDFSKIEAGKLELHPVNYNFCELNANIVAMFRFMAGKKGIDFTYEEHGELPRYLYGDDARLRQVLINICSNAVNFTVRGSIRLKISHADGKLTFEVSDTGPGIKPEDISTLFSPFARAGLLETRDVTGAGLGLPISKTFAEMMGGTIEVKSVYGEGSTFTVIIPCTPGDESKVKGADEKSRPALRAPEAKILLVDDNTLNLKVAFRLLGLYGITAEMVTSGFAAIDSVQENDYHIVFMDQMMPGMDGVEATKKIRALGGKYEKLPIVALTANVTQGVREMFLANGLDDYISKPIELGALNGILQRWLPEEIVESNTRYMAPRTPPSEDKPGGFWDEVAGISCINAELGKNRVAGIEEVYREMLELLCGRLSEDCQNMETFLNDGDLENFAILIHGMKSSLSTIGAMALAERALELETSSKGGDRQLCDEKLPDFLGDLRSLGAKLAPICGLKDDALPADRPSGLPVILEKGVKAALNAATMYDGDKCMEVVGKLLHYDFGAETDEILKNVKNAVKNFDFEEAAGLLKRF